MRDCTPDCPELAVVPPGNFLMGSPPTESGRNLDGDEDPQQRVTILDAFAVGKFAITRDEFARFAEDTLPSITTPLESPLASVRLRAAMLPSLGH